MRGVEGGDWRENGGRASWGGVKREREHSHSLFSAWLGLERGGGGAEGRRACGRERERERLERDGAGM